jgi:hypothetical protein
LRRSLAAQAKSSKIRLSLIEAPAVIRSYDAQRGAIVDNATILIQFIQCRGGQW